MPTLADRFRVEFARRGQTLKLSRRLSEQFRYAKEFVEDEHPRDEEGKFTDGGQRKSKTTFVPSPTRTHTKANDAVRSAIDKMEVLGIDLPEQIQVKTLSTKRFIAWHDSNDHEIGHRVTINPAAPYWKDAAENAKRYHETGHFSTDDPHHPVIHEVGHAIHQKGMNVSRRSSLLNHQFHGEQKSQIESEVSRYATTNGLEFVAEVFAGKVAGKTYNETIDRLYSFLGGPSVKNAS